MKKFHQFLACLVINLLCGCGTTEVKLNSSQTEAVQLIPIDAAIKIVERDMGPDWLKNPIAYQNITSTFQVLLDCHSESFHLRDVQDLEATHNAFGSTCIVGEYTGIVPILKPNAALNLQSHPYEFCSGHIARGLPVPRYTYFIPRCIADTELATLKQAILTLAAYDATPEIEKMPQQVESSAPVKPKPQSENDELLVELTFWDSIKNSVNVDDFKAYLEQYPHGKFVSLARNRITTLSH